MNVKMTMFAAAAVSVVFFSCDSDSPLQSQEKVATVAAKVSGCGGFEETAKRTAYAPVETGECISWLYDSEGKTLVFTDRRVTLNCCGERSITAEMKDGTLVITETDRPENGTGRCRCECDFDFMIEISGVAPGEIEVTVVRDVDGSVKTVCSGALDTAYESGVLFQEHAQSGRPSHAE